MGPKKEKLTMLSIIEKYDHIATLEMQIKRERKERRMRKTNKLTKKPVEFEDMFEVEEPRKNKIRRLQRG